MCNHQNKKPYVPNLATTCTIQNWYAHADTANMEYPNLPHDSKGRCIFHSQDRNWKTANQCGERFAELFAVMAGDEQLSDLDFREAVLMGIEVGGEQAERTHAIREKHISISNLNISKPIRFQGARFLEQLVISELDCTESVNFDEAVFKDGMTLKHCHFKEFVSFGAECRFEHNAILEGCQFEQFVSFNEAVFMKQFCMSDVHCWHVAYFEQMNQIADDLICQFFNVRFDDYTSFSNSVFNSSVQFEYCRFGAETHFENTAFRQRLQLVKPVVGEKIYFMGTRPGVKLFENAVDIELTEESFGPAGQIIFQNANLFNSNPPFKEKLRTLELNHQVEIREGCLLYRTSIERVFEYSQLGQFLVEDLARVFARYFETKHLRSLKVDVMRDLKTEIIRVVFHTDESMSIPEFENLLQDAQQEMLEFMASPPQQPGALMADHLLQMSQVWQRLFVAQSLPLLEHFFANPDEAEMERIRKLLNLTVNVHVKNAVINSQIDAGGNIVVGDAALTTQKQIISSSK